MSHAFLKATMVDFGLGTSSGRYKEPSHRYNPTSVVERGRAWSSSPGLGHLTFIVLELERKARKLADAGGIFVTPTVVNRLKSTGSMQYPVHVGRYRAVRQNVSALSRPFVRVPTFFCPTVE